MFSMSLEKSENCSWCPLECHGLMMASGFGYSLSIEKMNTHTFNE